MHMQLKRDRAIALCCGRTLAWGDDSDPRSTLQLLQGLFLR